MLTPFTAATLAAFAVPSAAMLLAAPPLMADTARMRRDAADNLGHIRTMVAAGRLIHELQLERGMSVGFLSKRGDGATLAEQISRTDEAALSFRALVTGQSDGGTRKAAIEGLDSLATHRALIQNGQPSPAQAATGYSGRIGALLDLVAMAVKCAARGPLARLGTAYLNLISAKEAAGQERALLTGLLAKAEASSAERRKAQELREQQDLLLRLFAEGAGATLARLCGEKLAAPGRAVEALRDMAFGPARPSPADWFAAATRRMEAMKAVEMEMEETLMAAGSANTRRAGRNRRAIAAVMALAVVFLGGMATLNGGGL